MDKAGDLALLWVLGLTLGQDGECPGSLHARTTPSAGGPTVLRGRDRHFSAFRGSLLRESEAGGKSSALR